MVCFTEVKIYYFSTYVNQLKNVIANYVDLCYQLPM